MTPFYADEWLTIYGGDNRDVLRALPAESVNCVVTSPPYWGLRDYGVTPSVWGPLDHEHEFGMAVRYESLPQGDQYRWKETGPVADARCRCGAWVGALGLEPTPEEYVAHIVDVFRAVRRVLRSDGTLWLNLGDSYAAERGGTHQPAETLAGGRHGKTVAGERVNRGRADGYSPTRNARGIGLKHKDLVGIPWRVAFALQADGWYLRSDIIWSKPNPMPESVTDRPTKSHEYLFLLTKSARYSYDAVREAAQSGPSDLRKMAEGKERIGGLTKEQTDVRLRASSLTNMGRKRAVGGKQLASARASSPSTERRMGGFNDRWDASEDNGTAPVGRNLRSVWTVATQPYPGAHFATFPPKLVEPCIKAGCPEGGTVMDPFGGTGTVGMVAASLSRRAVLIDLNPDYLRQCLARNAQTPLGLGA